MTDVSRLDLPVGSIGRHANGWWGMMMLIVTEGALFVYLLFAYYYAAVQHSRDWLPQDLPDFKLSLPDTIVLLLSSLVVWRGESLLKQRPIRRLDGDLFGRRGVDGHRVRRRAGGGMAAERSLRPFRVPTGRCITSSPAFTCCTSSQAFSSC